VDVGLEIAAALGARTAGAPAAAATGTAGPAEQVREDVADSAAEGAGVEATARATGAAEDPPARVVLAPLLGVGQDASPGFLSGWYCRASLR
jgi:hypothetical protein